MNIYGYTAKDLKCPDCCATAPQDQIRLDAIECGQPTAIITFDCLQCGTDQFIPDDLEILSANTIE